MKAKIKTTRGKSKTQKAQSVLSTDIIFLFRRIFLRLQQVSFALVNFTPARQKINPDFLCGE